MARIPVILKDTFVYTFFNTLTALVPFLLLPILTRYLSPADYGVLSMFAILVFLLGPFIRLETVVALRRFFFESRKDFLEDVGTSITITCLMFLIITGIWFIAQFFMNDLLEVPMIWVLGAIVVAFGAAMTSYLVGLYQIQSKAVQVGLRSTILAVLVFVPTVILVVYFGFDWRGRTLTQLVVAILVEIPMALYLIHKMFPFKWRINKERARHLLRFGLPLIPFSLASYFLMTTDRLMLNHFLTVEIVGIYSVAVQIVSAVRLLLNSFISGWEVWVFGTLKEPTERNRARVVLVFYAFTLLILACVFSIIFILPHILPWLVGERYTSSYQFFAWLAVAEMFKAMANALQTFFLYKKKTPMLNYILLAQAGTNIALALLLVQKFGAIGAAQASLLSAALGFLITFGLLWRQMDLPWLRFLFIIKPWEKGVRSGV